MAPTQTLRVDAYGLLPSLFIALMLVLAMLGVVAHAAVLWHVTGALPRHLRPRPGDCPEPGPPFVRNERRARRRRRAVVAGSGGSSRV
jgi:hypothetical protein